MEILNFKPSNSKGVNKLMVIFLIINVGTEKKNWFKRIN